MEATKWTPTLRTTLGAFRIPTFGGALCPNDDARRTQNDDADLAGALRRRSERKSNRRHCSASTPKKCLPTGSASTPPVAGLHQDGIV
jgi:hypothetical protein